MDRPNAGPGAPLRKDVTGNTEHQRGKRQVGHQLTVVPLEYLEDPSTDWNSKLLGKKEGMTYVTRDTEGRLRIATATGPKRTDPWTLSIEEAPEDGQLYARQNGEWALAVSQQTYSVAEANVTHPSPPLTLNLTGQGNEELQPPAGYVTLVDGYAAQVRRGSNLEALPDGRIRVLSDGLYRIDAYADISFSTATVTVSAVFSFEAPGGAVSYSPRAVHSRLPNFGNIGNISGQGVAELTAGTIIGIAFSSEDTGVLTVHTSTILIEFWGN